MPGVYANECYKKKTLVYAGTFPTPRAKGKAKPAAKKTQAKPAKKGLFFVYEDAHTYVPSMNTQEHSSKPPAPCHMYKYMCVYKESTYVMSLNKKKSPGPGRKK